jgi:hypothetical protein
MTGRLEQGLRTIEDAIARFGRLVAERSPMIVFLRDPTWDDVREQDWCRALLSRAGMADSGCRAVGNRTSTDRVSVGAGLPQPFTGKPAIQLPAVSQLERHSIAMFGRRTVGEIQALKMVQDVWRIHGGRSQSHQ